jgi:hypothetical protein
MIIERLVIPGVVRNGVIVPQGDAPLPEGTEVQITFATTAVPLELQAEFDAWERLSDEAWGLISDVDTTLNTAG